MRKNSSVARNSVKKSTVLTYTYYIRIKIYDFWSAIRNNSFSPKIVNTYIYGWLFNRLKWLNNNKTIIYEYNIPRNWSICKHAKIYTYINIDKMDNILFCIILL